MVLQSLARPLHRSFPAFVPCNLPKFFEWDGFGVAVHEGDALAVFGKRLARRPSFPFARYARATVPRDSQVSKTNAAHTHASVKIARGWIGGKRSAEAPYGICKRRSQRR